MVIITEELLRKRAEHNNFELSTLEEVSLHQQGIERIVNIDKWCRNIKILYLQSNLIPKIENVGRLKKLEYLNLALNNITKIENLDGCESLRKLDLTVNFIADLTCIEVLRLNSLLEDLHLTGNPCTRYSGYRDFVIATLPQLERLDGRDIEKSDRILACQRYAEIRDTILQQQDIYKKEDSQNPSNAGNYSDNSYKEFRESFDECKDSCCYNDELTNEEREKLYWSTPSQYTPEGRVEMHNHIRKQEAMKSKHQNKTKDSEIARIEKRYFKDDGEPLNVNTAKLQFTLKGDEKQGFYTLDVACYKHLDTSYINVDVQPKFVRVDIKGHVLQLVLTKEVNPDKSTVRRSQTTGHILVEMPLARDFLKFSCQLDLKNHKEAQMVPAGVLGHQMLDEMKGECNVSPSNLTAMVKQFEKEQNDDININLSDISELDFMDDPDVPPLI